MNHEKKHQRCPFIAMACGLGIFPRRTFNLQIQRIRTSPTRSTTGSAFRRSHTEHGHRHPPARRRPTQASSNSSGTASSSPPPALEGTPARRGREEEAKVHNRTAVAQTALPRHHGSASPLRRSRATSRRRTGAEQATATAASLPPPRKLQHTS